MEDYFFYIVQPFERVGFGIAENIKDRNHKYSSHSGKIVNFPYVYGGHRPHAKALERTIKREFVDNLWIVEDWKTEWLNEDVTSDTLKEYVDRLILERHYKLKLVMSNYNFTKQIS